MALITYEFQATDENRKRYNILGPALIGTGRLTVNGNLRAVQIEVCHVAGGHVYVVYIADMGQGHMLCEEEVGGGLDNLIQELDQFESKGITMDRDGWEFCSK